MKRVQYGSEAFETSDEVAGLLLELSATLARAGSAEIVGFPAVGTDGDVHRVQFVIGPATHLSVQPDQSPLPEPVDEGATRSMRRLLQRNTPRRYHSYGLRDGGFGSSTDDY